MTKQTVSIYDYRRDLSPQLNEEFVNILYTHFNLIMTLRKRALWNRRMMHT